MGGRRLRHLCDRSGVRVGGHAAAGGPDERRRPAPRGRDGRRAGAAGLRSVRPRRQLRRGGRPHERVLAGGRGPGEHGPRTGRARMGCRCPAVGRERGLRSGPFAADRGPLARCGPPRRPFLELREPQSIAGELHQGQLAEVLLAGGWPACGWPVRATDDDCESSPNLVRLTAIALIDSDTLDEGGVDSSRHQRHGPRRGEAGARRWTGRGTVTDVGGPESLAARLTRARGAGRGRPDVVVSDLLDALEASSNIEAATWSVLGEAYHRLGQEDEAAHADAGAGLYDAAHASELTASDAADIAKALNAVGRFGHVPAGPDGARPRRARRRPPAGAGRSGDGTGPRGQAVTARRNVAELLSETDRFRQARDELDLALALAPDDVEPSSTPHGWPWRPVSPSEPRASSRVPRHGPSEVRVLATMAELERRAGRLDTALERLQQVAALDGTDARSTAVHARILRDGGRAQEALDVLDEFEPEAPGDASLLRVRSQIRCRSATTRARWMTPVRSSSSDRRAPVRTCSSGWCSSPARRSMSTRRPSGLPSTASPEPCSWPRMSLPRTVAEVRHCWRWAGLTMRSRRSGGRFRSSRTRSRGSTRWPERCGSPEIRTRRLPCSSRRWSTAKTARSSPPWVRCWPSWAARMRWRSSSGPSTWSRRRVPSPASPAC